MRLKNTIHFNTKAKAKRSHSWLFFFVLTTATFCFTIDSKAQDPKWEEGGKIETVEIEIVKPREITLPKANRNFEKIAPRPSEPIKPPITYDFRAFSFQTPQISSPIRPLKLKQEGQSKLYGNYV